MENFTECLDKAIELSGWDKFKERRRAAAKLGKLRGIGMAFVIEAHGLGMSEEATIEIQPDGRAKLLIGTMSNGQGHETTYAQIMATDLGVGTDDVDVIQGDTDIIPNGNGTGASRSITVGGRRYGLPAERFSPTPKSSRQGYFRQRPNASM